MPLFEAQVAQTLIAANEAMKIASSQITELQRRLRTVGEENARLRSLAEHLVETWACTNSFAPGCEHMCKCPLCLATRALSSPGAESAVT